MDNEARRLWDDAAETFDEEADHGLGTEAALRAWTALMARWLPQERARVLDAGCGTGSMSVLMAGLGHAVTGIDFSRAMLEQARNKAREREVALDLLVMDAAMPSFARAAFDVVVCRHVLWALPAMQQVLQRWSTLLCTGGRFVLVEGLWHTGGGLPAQEVLAALPEQMSLAAVERLDGVADCWGQVVADERYVIVGNLVG